MLDDLYFLHIPKTAGTSLRYWLLDLFNSDDFLECYHLNPLQHKSREELARYHFFSGHFGLKLHKLLTQKPKTITWLRDPVEREISQYFYLKANAQEFLGHSDDPGSSIHPLSSDYLESVQQLNLPQLCQKEHIGYCDNLQVRYLADLSPGTKTKTFCTPEHLEKAKENLKRFSHFGICEWMQVSIDLFCYKFFLPPQKFKLFLNQGKPKKEDLFSDNELDIIRDSNKYDVKLYQFAQDLFQERVYEMLSQLKLEDQKKIFFVAPELSQKGKINVEKKDFFISNEEYTLKLESPVHSQIEKLFRNKPADSITKSTQLLFSEANYLLGWYPRQYYKPYETWIRWAGPNRSSTLYVTIAPGRYRISFPILIQKKPSVIDGIKMYVNDNHITLEKYLFPIKTDEKKFLLTGIIEEHHLLDYPTYSQIRIETSHVFPQQDVRKSGNNMRYVSFATNGFWIEPISCVPGLAEIICKLSSIKYPIMKVEKDLAIDSKKKPVIEPPSQEMIEYSYTLLQSLKQRVYQTEKNILKLNSLSQKQIGSLAKIRRRLSTLKEETKILSQQSNRTLSNTRTVENSARHISTKGSG